MSDQNAIKIIVDTNLWIWMLIGKKLASLKELLIQGKVRIYFSEELFEEIVKVIDYPRIQKIISKNKFYELISLLERVSDFLCKQPLITSAPCHQNKWQTGLELHPSSLSA